MSIAEQIKQKREELNMTQEELNQLGNVVIQTAILAEDSEFMQEVEALMKTGVSEQDAWNIVYGTYFAEVENTVANAFFPGFIIPE